MTSDKLTWLHLTDLHVGMGPDAHLWPNARQQVQADIRALKQKLGLIDFVFFTGDITQKGTEDEFMRAAKEIEELLDLAGSPRPKFVCVPGNHDLKLPSSGSGVSSLAEGFRRTGKPPAKFWDNDKSDLRKGIQVAFKNWIQWAEKHHTEWWGDDLQKGLLPGDVICSTEIRGNRIGIIGLNSAYLQLASGVKGDLSLSLRQFQNNFDISRWRLEHSVIFLLTHHPGSWLSEGSRNHLRNEIAPASSGVIHLFGHNHEPVLSVGDLSGGQRVELQGPSLFGLEKIEEPFASIDRIHGYILGQISNLKESRPNLRLWPRRGSTVAAGGWTVNPDPDSLLEEDGGTEGILLKTSHTHRELSSSVKKIEVSSVNKTVGSIVKDDVLLTRSAYIKTCTNLLPEVTTIRATLVGPMLTHPKWYSERRKPYRLYPDFDLTLRRRILELQKGDELLDDVRLIFRNTSRYVEKISSVVGEKERELFKKEVLSNIDRIWGSDAHKGPRICCVDTGNLKVAVVYDSTVLTNCRPRSGDPISSGYLIQSRERADIERATFDQVFEANYSNQLEEIAKLRKFIVSLWTE